MDAYEEDPRPGWDASVLRAAAAGLPTAYSVRRMADPGQPTDRVPGNLHIRWDDVLGITLWWTGTTHRCAPAALAPTVPPGTRRPRSKGDHPMGIRSKKKKREAEKAALTASARAGRLAGIAQKSAQDSVAKFQGTVVPALSEGAKDARKRADELVEQYLPAVQEQVQARGEKVAAFADTLSPRAEKLRHDLQDDYLPRARRTAGATNAVMAAMVTAAVDAARKELEKGQGDIKKAALATPPEKKKGRAGKVLLVLALTAAGAAAGYAAWKKSRPVEDPWAPPADFARAHYPASAATDTDSSEVSDTVGGAEAGDLANSLTSDADRASDTAPRDVKVDSADSSDLPEQGKVIDPVMNPEENPADPENGDASEGGKRGTHRGEA